ncbi:MAG: DUF6036 family nucleotidyltransferase, partial [Roseiflexaceae bacterium]
MALLTRRDIITALERLGQLALANGYTLHLVIVGGAAMVLGYNARQSTHDIDALFLPPPEAHIVRAWARVIAQEYCWTDDWLNDAAKGYLVGLSSGPVLLEAPGIEVRQPAVEQLLAMKLCAWRDDVDIADASRLLTDLAHTGRREELWRRLVPSVGTVPSPEVALAGARSFGG